MKVTRMAGALRLVLRLGAALAACQKQGETVSETSQDQGTAVTDQTAPSTTDQTAEAPAPTEQTPPVSKPAKKPSSGHASSGSKGTSSSYVADANTIRVPA